MSIKAKFCPSCGCPRPSNQENEIICFIKKAKPKLKALQSKIQTNIRSSLAKNIFIFVIVALSLLAMAFFQNKKWQESERFRIFIETERGTSKSTRYQEISGNKEDPEYDIVGKLEGTKYEPYFENFVGQVYNDKQFNQLAAKIDRELEIKKSLANAGIFGFLGILAGSLADPLSFFVVCAFLIFTKKTKWKNYNFWLFIAISTALGGIIAESALYQIQITRIWGQSLFVKFLASFIHSIICIIILEAKPVKNILYLKPPS